MYDEDTDEFIEPAWVCRWCDHLDYGPEWGMQPRPSRRPVMICPACRGCAA